MDAVRQLLLVLSATGDPYPQDADRVIEIAHDKCTLAGITPQIAHKRYEGGHGLTKKRFNDIVSWFAKDFSWLTSESVV